MTDTTLVRNSWLMDLNAKKDIEDESKKFDVSESEMARKLIDIGWEVWTGLETHKQDDILAGATLGEIEQKGEEQNVRD